MLKQRIARIRVATRGVGYAIRSEVHMKIHVVASILTVVLGALLHISRFEWVAIVMVIGMVWVAELFNTVAEFLVDQRSKRRSMRSMLIKDMAAGAVLVASGTALVVGGLIFGPHLVRVIFILKAGWRLA
jgi:diacylglycerol kinase